MHGPHGLWGPGRTCWHSSSLRGLQCQIDGIGVQSVLNGYEIATF
jgi:hypothetical protein